MICTFSQQPSMKQNSLSSFLKGKLKVNFLKTRRRPLGSSQLVICSLRVDVTLQSQCCLSWLFPALTKHSRMAAHPMFQLFFNLFSMYSFPIPTIASSKTSNVSYTTTSMPTYPSCLQPNISWDVQALRLSLSNKFCWVFTPSNKLTNISGVDICHTGCWVPGTLSENLPSMSIEPSFEK